MKGNKKVILIIVFIVVVLGGIVAGIFLVGRSQEIRKKAAPATTLAVSPPSQQRNAGETFTFSVLMSSGENRVTGVEYHLVYDPSAFEVTSIARGSDIANFTYVVREEIDNTAGTVWYASLTLDRSNAVQGTSLETLIVAGRVKSDAITGTYSFEFSDRSAVAGVEEDQNVLVGVTPGAILVSALSLPSPTPTPAPGSPTPTPAPTSSPTSYPTATPTASPYGGYGGGLDSTPVPTFPPDVPVTGVSLPVIFGIGAGTLLLIGSLVLLF